MRVLLTPVLTFGAVCHTAQNVGTGVVIRIRSTPDHWHTLLTFYQPLPPCLLRLRILSQLSREV